MNIIKFPIETTLMDHFEEAHHALVLAAKIAHLQKHPEAENISKLIDSLEEISIRTSEESYSREKKH